MQRCLAQCVLYKSAIKAKIPCQTTLQPESWWVCKAAGSSTCQGVRGTRGSPLSMHAPSLQDAGTMEETLWRSTGRGCTDVYVVNAWGLGRRAITRVMLENLYCVGAKSESPSYAFHAGHRQMGSVCIQQCYAVWDPPCRTGSCSGCLEGVDTSCKSKVGLAAAKWSGRDQQLLLQECIMLYQ